MVVGVVTTAVVVAVVQGDDAAEVSMAEEVGVGTIGDRMFSGGAIDTVQKD